VRADFEEIYEYLEKQRPTAAQRLKSAIERQIGWLIYFPYMAPTTDEAGVRELTLARHPDKIYYEVAGEEVRVLYIRHARRRPRGRKR
jgi:plasmid stabilization system protein ParE